MVLGVYVFRSLSEYIYRLCMYVCTFYVSGVVNIVLDLTVQLVLAYASQSSRQEIYFPRQGLLTEDYFI